MLKNQNNDFSEIIIFLAITKLRLSAYLCTPSGTPKLSLWLSLMIPNLFPYPLPKIIPDVKKLRNARKNIYNIYYVIQILRFYSF